MRLYPRRYIRDMERLLVAWPRRRWVAALLLTPVVGALFAVAGGALLPEPAPLSWVALTTLAAPLGAAVLASYLPAVGWRPEIGCTPCAAVSGMTIVGASVMQASAPLNTGNAAIALLLVGFGLFQRATAPAACPA